MPRTLPPSRHGPPPPYTALQLDAIFPWHLGRLYADPPDFGFLLRFGLSLLFRAIDGFPLTQRSPEEYPARLMRPYARNPDRVIARIDRALTWLRALKETMDGSTKFLRPLRQRKPRPEASPEDAAPPVANPRPHTPYDPVMADRNRMLRAFQTDTIARITRRVTRAFGIAPGHEVYPEFLLTFHETPAECAQRHHGVRPAETAPTAAYWRRRQRARDAQLAHARANAIDPETLPVPHPTPIPTPRRHKPQRE